MKTITSKQVCDALSNFPVIEASAVVEGSRIVSLVCPLRDCDAPCFRVDIDRLPCCLFPEYELSEDAIICSEET